MRRLTPLIVLIILGGCSDGSGGDRGAPAAQADVSKPVDQATLDSMPPEARRSAENSMKAGDAMKAQLDARYGGKH